MKKTIIKIFTAMVVAGIIVGTTTVSASAWSISDLLKFLQDRFGIVRIVANTNDCTSGNCNTPTIDCTDGKCNQTPTTTPSSDEVKAVFELVNKERKEAGLGTVTLSTELCNVADVRAKEIVRSFSHTRPNGTSCFTAFKEGSITYRYAGENIAYGQKSASAVMSAWMNSSGHRANILNKNFGKIGIACYEYSGRKYWVQLFTN